MPDLSLKGSHDYWFNYQDTMIYRVVTFMEGVETWTLDGNQELEQAIQQLGQELDDLTGIDMTQMGKESLFVRVACNIKSSRSLRLLQAIDTAHPGSASRLLIYAEEDSEGSDDPSGIFLRRNIVFERLRLLSRVFSEKRFNIVLKALEGEDHE
ncbi:MAG: type IVB secretion system protein IcmW [Proteobacteria bacterium]|nr:type IVB secretion system protein IcmW [Pseudomonadota bacterium]